MVLLSTAAVIVNKIQRALFFNFCQQRVQCVGKAQVSLLSQNSTSSWESSM